jgi:hypothetical protein
MPADEMILARIRETYAGRAENDLDPHADGLAIMEMQRELGALPAGLTERVCLTGGFAQITTVRRSGIESSILRRWEPTPDERASRQHIDAIRAAMGRPAAFM